MESSFSLIPAHDGRLDELAPVDEAIANSTKKIGPPWGWPDDLMRFGAEDDRQLTAGAPGRASGALSDGAAKAGAPGCGAGGVPLALWK